MSSYEARLSAELTHPVTARRQTVVSAVLLAKLRRHGILFPLPTVAASRAARLGLPLACAMVTMESGGGMNVFGHDSDAHGHCPGYGWGTVTKTKYLAFKHLRDLEGRSNGVGPVQLTSPGLQNEADRIGGCWVPQHNMAVGFHYLHDLILEHGVEGGCVAYNGSGAAAERYGRQFLLLAQHFKAAGCGSLVNIVR